jgi:hypothetical protein
MNTLIRSILVGALVLFSPVSFALYFDGGLGNASVEIEDFDGSDTYFKLAIGSEISKNIEIEGGYWDLGEAEDTGITASADGFFGDAKFSHNFNSDTSIFGKIGLYMWDGKVCFGIFGCTSDDGNDLFYGGGISFAMGSGHLNLELLKTELGADLGDFDVTTIGGSYSIPFGK